MRKILVAVVAACLFWGVWIFLADLMKVPRSNTGGPGKPKDAGGTGVSAGLASGVANTPALELSNLPEEQGTNSAQTTTGRTATGQISESALRQIGALQQDKERRTPTQKKIDSQLIYAARMERGEPVAAEVPGLRVELDKDDAGRVLVDIKAEVTDELLEEIKRKGGEVVNSFREYSAIRAWIRLEQAEALASRRDVAFVEPAAVATTNSGSVNSEGDVAHNANTARTTFSVTGAGVKVGILSDSVDHLENSQELEDLGVVTVLEGQSGVPANGEGTAMLEIVHDLAPGAELYYATAFNGAANFANNIRQLRAAGCDIIIDDVSYSNESPFQDGIIAQAVNEVTQDGALFFSSASNSGNKNDAQSGVWEGDFVDSGQTVSNNRGQLHSFGNSNYDMAVAGGSVNQTRVDMFWADPLGRAVNDYDVYVLDSTGQNVVAASTTTQNGFQDPYERIAKLEVDQRVAVVRYSGEGRYIHLGTGRGRLSISTSGQTHGHSCAVNAFCVAAVSARNATTAFTTANKVEQFSSDGLRRIFFEADGTPITPGNFSSTGGTVRQKPDIAAADGIVTTLPANTGLNPFYGTSAAAPHAGAVAALLKSYNPGLTAAEIRVALTTSALDIESAGVDRDAGHGLVMVDLALQAVGASGAPSISNFSPTNGNAGTVVTISGNKFSGAQSVKFNGANAEFVVDSAMQITATVPAGASTGPISITTPAGTATSARSFQILLSPAITGFSPVSGSAGTIVVITGANLNGATSVSFGGTVAAVFTVNSASQITATVPGGATTGKINVITPNGTAVSAGTFTISAGPVVGLLTPNAGPVGSTVTIAGANFVEVTGVSFNNLPATAYKVNSASQITATVPAGASTGPVRVTTAAGTAVSGGNFSVLSTPVVTAINPTTGLPGTVVTIAGNGFEGATAVSFNGMAAASFSVADSTQIIATAPAGVTTGPVRVTTPGGTSAGNVTFTALSATGNDNFAAAQTIAGPNGTVNGSTVAATREVGEPLHAGNVGGRSIWYQWSAPANGTWTFDTVGSSFDTLIAVYTGTALDNLTVAAYNDDIVPGAVTNSRVTFVASAGSAYRIAVDGYSDGPESSVPPAAGSVVLNWAQTVVNPAIGGFSPASGQIGSTVTITGANFNGATSVTFNGTPATFTVNSATQITTTIPVGATSGPIKVTTPGGIASSTASFTVLNATGNDSFANGLIINGNSGSVSANSASATKEGGEPNHAGNSGGKSVWFLWTAPSSGLWTFDTGGSSFDTLLAVYTGTSLNTLIAITANDDWSGQFTSQVSFAAVGGTTYRLAVDGYNGVGGNAVLNWNSTPNMPVIAGFTPGTGVVGTGVTINGSNLSGAIGVKFNGVSATGFAVNSASEVAASVPFGASTGPISVITTNGSAQSATSFVVTAPQPANDNFANRRILDANATSAFGQNIGATKEAGELNHAGNGGGKSAWWSWICPNSGTYVITTRGSGFDTLLSVYTGNSLGSLTVVSSSDDAPNLGRESLATFDANAGAVYQIAVDGYNGDSGSIILSIYSVTPSQTIYYTSFDVGEGYNANLPLAGQNGWTSQNPGQNGLIFNAFGDLSHQAYLGYDSPVLGGSCWLWYPLDFTPDINRRPVVIFSTYMGIEDSSNFQYDIFEWDFYSRAGDFLFSVEFDNYTLDINYSQDDQAGSKWTGKTFRNGRMYYLEVTMDFAGNRWSATLDGVVLAQGQAISTAGAALDLGDIDAAWYRVPGGFGDNAMVFDDYRVMAKPSQIPRIVTPPLNQAVVAGGNATLFVVVDSELPVSYQWRLNGADIPGATGPVLALNGVTAAQAGSYTVVATSAAGTVTSAAAVLTVIQHPNLTPYRPSAWSDKMVIFTTPGSVSDAAVLYDHQDVLVNWAVLNAAGGSAITNKFYTQLYVDDALKSSWFTTELAPDFFSYITNHNLGKLPVGAHTFRIETDTTEVVDESNEEDNAYSRTVLVSTTNNVPPQIGSVSRGADGTVQFTLTGIPMRSYEILASTNLVNWSVLSTIVNSNANGTLPYVDRSSTNFDRRFFRGRLKQL